MIKQGTIVTVTLEPAHRRITGTVVSASRRTGHPLGYWVRIATGEYLYDARDVATK